MKSKHPADTFLRVTSSGLKGLDDTLIVWALKNQLVR